MIFDIKKALPYSFEFDGREYGLNLAFDNVLKVLELFRDDLLSSYEKYEFALAMLVNDKKSPPVESVEVIFNEYISLNKNKGNSGKLKTFDFEQDSIYIYSSFMTDYGIDLFNQQGKLHWWKFISLFQGLSDKTKMREVMNIRQRPVPEPNKYNAEEIRRLYELKAYYALDISQEEREQNFRSGIEHLAGVLKSRAKGR